MVVRVRMLLGSGGCPSDIAKSFPVVLLKVDSGGRITVQGRRHFFAWENKMEEEGGTQSSIATEISDLMDAAVSVSQQKAEEKKRKAKETKIKRQVKRLRENEAGGNGGGSQQEDGTKWYKSGEIAIMIEHLENNYNFLFGNCKKASYKQQRVKAWNNLMEALNLWNDQTGTDVERDLESVKRKIENLKQRG